MSRLTLEVSNAIRAVFNACQHDIDRWQRNLDRRKAEGEDTANPHCFQCQQQQDQQRRRKMFNLIGRKPNDH